MTNRLDNKEYREGILLAAITSIELFIKVFSLAGIEPIKAMDYILEAAEFTEAEMEEVQTILKEAYNVMEKELEVTPVDVFLGVITKLIEKKQPEYSREIDKEIKKAVEIKVAEIKSNGVVN